LSLLHIHGAAPVGSSTISDRWLDSAVADKTSATFFRVNDHRGMKQDLGRDLQHSRSIEFFVLRVVDASGVRAD